jgi:hypothetical protein
MIATGRKHDVNATVLWRVDTWQPTSDACDHVQG